jgi:DNA-binding response OmpR family regulator
MIVAAWAMTLADPVLDMRILVVDDELLNVELLAAVLGDAGFTAVETTTSPAEALESCAAGTPACCCWTCICRALTGLRSWTRSVPRSGPTRDHR